MEDVHLEGEGGIPEGVLRPAIVHRAPVEMLQTDREYVVDRNWSRSARIFAQGKGRRYFIDVYTGAPQNRLSQNK